MADRRRILVLFAHPALHKSRVHAALAAAARTVEGVTFHDLYERYPDFQVDVAREQGLLASHDLLVWQHPLYWYSSPALLKQWQDLVLEPGFAYGEDGTALHGKQVLSALSVGGTEAAYGPEGINAFPLRRFLTPFEQTARFCGMTYLPPFVVHNARGLSPQAVAGHAARYGRLLAQLRDGAQGDSHDPAGPV